MIRSKARFKPTLPVKLLHNFYFIKFDKNENQYFLPVSVEPSDITYLPTANFIKVVIRILQKLYLKMQLT